MLYCFTGYSQFDFKFILNNWTQKVINKKKYTICPRSSDPFYKVTYYIKWVTTSWTYSIYMCVCVLSMNHIIRAQFNSVPFRRKEREKDLRRSSTGSGRKKSLTRSGMTLKDRYNLYVCTITCDLHLQCSFFCIYGQF